MRVGCLVRRTMIVDHAGHLYTVSMRGKVVDVSGEHITVLGTGPHRWTIEPWHAIDWTVVGFEALS